MSGVTERAGSIAAKGLTPLLDTLFLLLLTLLVTSEARTATSEELVRIVLPQVEPSPGGAAEPTRQLVLEVDAGSRVRLEGSEDVLATRAELDRSLAAALGESLPEEVGIEIRGDRSARHGVVVELLQQLRLRGFASVSLIARGVAESTGEDRR